MTQKNLEDAKLVMCGCHEVGWHLVNHLLEQGIRFSHFVSIDEQKAKKIGSAGYVSFENLAKKYNVPIYYAKSYSLKDPEDQAFFEQNKFDLIVQGGWARLFPEKVLSTLNIGAIGVHGSSEPLPKGRGRCPINWSLIEGKDKFILHYFLIKPGVDDGDIFYHETFDINLWDDCRTLYYKNAMITQRVLLDWIPKLLAGDFTLTPQEGEPTYYPKRTPEDGLADWSKSVLELHNFIRAITKPYPGAFSFIDGEKVMLWKAQPFDSKIPYPKAKVGEVVEVFQTGDAVVKCLDGLLLLREYEVKRELKPGLLFSS